MKNSTFLHSCSSKHEMKTSCASVFTWCLRLSFESGEIGGLVWFLSFLSTLLVTQDNQTRWVRKHVPCQHVRLNTHFIQCVFDLTRGSQKSKPPSDMNARKFALFKVMTLFLFHRCEWKPQHARRLANKQTHQSRHIPAKVHLTERNVFIYKRPINVSAVWSVAAGILGHHF